MCCCSLHWLSSKKKITLNPCLFHFFPCTEILAISNNNFGGELTDTFGTLESLETIDVSGNLFEGPIPSSIFEVSTIRLVYLCQNELSGPLPGNYGSATELRDLYVSENKLTGVIPNITDGQLLKLNEFLVRLLLCFWSNLTRGLFSVVNCQLGFLIFSCSNIHMRSYKTMISREPCPSQYATCGYQRPCWKTCGPIATTLAALTQKWSANAALNAFSKKVRPLDFYSTHRRVACMAGCILQRSYRACNKLLLGLFVLLQTTNW